MAAVDEIAQQEIARLQGITSELLPAAKAVIAEAEYDPECSCYHAAPEQIERLDLAIKKAEAVRPSPV